MTDYPRTFRQWRLIKPLVNNELTLDHFELHEAPTPELGEGQALVRVKLINLHSGTRARMARDGSGGMSGMTPVGGTDRTNYACAEVIASRDKTFREGDLIACQSGWQDHQIVSSDDDSVGYGRANEFVRALNGANAPMTYAFRPEMRRSWTPEVLMDVFGTSGMTAYFGIRSCGPIMPRDKVLVAGAGGSVGSIAAQLAKAAGAYVVGLAGGEDRCAWVKATLGIDACLDYRADDLERRLRQCFPDGIDVYSDGIGGKLTDQVVAAMNRDGRLFAYGGAAAFYADDAEGAKVDYSSLKRAFGMSAEAELAAAAKNIKVECFVVFDFYHERIEAENELSRLLRASKLKPITNVTRGFERLPESIVAMYAGSRSGKAQVDFEAAN